MFRDVFSYQGLFAFRLQFTGKLHKGPTSYLYSTAEIFRETSVKEFTYLSSEPLLNLKLSAYTLLR